MIKYEGEETKYNYNLSDVESILKYLSDNKGIFKNKSYNFS